MSTQKAIFVRAVILLTVFRSILSIHAIEIYNEFGSTSETLEFPLFFLFIRLLDTTSVRSISTSPILNAFYGPGKGIVLATLFIPAV